MPSLLLSSALLAANPNPALHQNVRHPCDGLSRHSRHPGMSPLSTDFQEHVGVLAIGEHARTLPRTDMLARLAGKDAARGAQTIDAARKGGGRGRASCVPAIENWPTSLSGCSRRAGKNLQLRSRRRLVRRSMICREVLPSPLADDDGDGIIRSTSSGTLAPMA